MSSIIKNIKNSNQEGFYYKANNLKVIRGTNSLDLVNRTEKDFETSILNDKGYFKHIWSFFIDIYDNIGYKDDIQETEFNYSYSKLIIDYNNNKGLQKQLILLGDFDFDSLSIGNSSIEKKLLPLRNLNISSLKLFVHKSPELLEQFELFITTQEEKSKLIKRNQSITTKNNLNNNTFKI